MKRLVVASLIVLLPIALTGISRAGVDSYEIDITSLEEKYSVTETILLSSFNESVFLVWIQEGAADIGVSANDKSVNVEKNGNVYAVNLSSINATEISLAITFDLPSSTQTFEKKFLYDVDSIKVTVDNKVVFSSENITTGSDVNLLLQKGTVPSSSYLYTTVLLVILLIILMVYTLKKHRVTAKKPLIETPELLKTKKELLMLVLKEIEKKYRAKELTEETYNKLKEFYKKEAVDVMKKLEEGKGS